MTMGNALRLLPNKVYLGLRALGHHFVIERRKGQNTVRVFSLPSPDINPEHDIHLRFQITTTVNRGGVELETRLDCGFRPEEVMITDGLVTWEEADEEGTRDNITITKAMHLHQFSFGEQGPDWLGAGSIGDAGTLTRAVVGSLRWLIGPSKDWFVTNINQDGGEKDCFYFDTGDSHHPMGFSPAAECPPLSEALLPSIGGVGYLYTVNDLYATLSGLHQKLVSIRQLGPEFSIFEME